MYSNDVLGGIVPPFHFTVHVLTQVSSQVHAHCSVISPWVAGYVKVGPPTGEREHFISRRHTHLYPHCPAGGCWACQPWGGGRNGSRTGALPESKQHEQVTFVAQSCKAKITSIRWDRFRRCEFTHHQFILRSTLALSSLTGDVLYDFFCGETIIIGFIPLFSNEKGEHHVWLCLVSLPIT